VRLKAGKNPTAAANLIRKREKTVSMKRRSNHILIHNNSLTTIIS